MYFHHVKNVRVVAYGANFYIDDSISGPNGDYYGAGSSFVGFHGDSKDITWLGGTFFGNRKGLPSTTLNNAFWEESVTGLTIQDVEIRGDYFNGSAFAGVYGYAVSYLHIQIRNAAIAFDLAYQEHLLIEDVRASAGASLGATGIKIFSDGPTFGINGVTGPDGTSRFLAGGSSNHIVIRNSLLSGFATQIYLDGVDTARVTRSVIRDGRSGPYPSAAGIALVTSPVTHSLGLLTRNIVIDDDEIHDNGGPGILMATGGYGLSSVTIRNSRIYDNRGPGVGGPSYAKMTDLLLSKDDFTSRSPGRSAQSSAVDPALIGSPEPALPGP